MKALAVLLMLCAAGLAAERAAPGREVVHPQARFKMSVPGGWTGSLMGPGEMGEGASGAVFKSSSSARLVVVFYAAGNPHFKDAADFLARQTAALPVSPAGERSGPVEPAMLGALEGKRLLREKRELRELVTAADAPGGFYAATCSSFARDWRRAKPQFDRLLSSFAVLAPSKPGLP